MTIHLNIPFDVIIERSPMSLSASSDLANALWCVSTEDRAPLESIEKVQCHSSPFSSLEKGRDSSSLRLLALRSCRWQRLEKLHWKMVLCTGCWQMDSLGFEEGLQLSLRLPVFHSQATLVFVLETSSKCDWQAPILSQNACWISFPGYCAFGRTIWKEEQHPIR